MASAVAVTGPRPSRRAADDFDQGLFAGLGGLFLTHDRGVELRLGPDQRELVQALGGDPELGAAGVEPRHPLIRGERLQPTLPFRFRPCLFVAQGTEPEQGVVQFFGIAGLEPGFLFHPGNGLAVEAAEIGGALRVEPAASHDGLGAAFFQRCVIEIGVGARGKDFERQRRRLGQIDGDDADLAVLDAPQHGFEAFDVHRLVQAVADRLVGERMVGDLTLAGQVFGTGDLIGEHRGDQVFGLHAHELRRHLLAALETRQGQGHAGHPAPARVEHRRIEQRLDQDLAHAGGMEIARDFGKIEAVRGGEREDDVVLGRRGLELEVELAAEALAQRQTQARLMRLP